ncbi:flagellar hook-associated protein 2 [Pseudoduganella lurida]|uniref:Flagellar hook-associated protein 2 n=1 Tax=Pseudoduganella lurida TaxID=1036180 RepID=A0A562RL06_9BURK|nr:flagellar filament capping protein FliD [Pseudoduganella lurida]TWI69728.1 flagellar hook-associated protein 2 [Pseudoduganella lurida]
MTTDNRSMNIANSPISAYLQGGSGLQGTATTKSASGTAARSAGVQVLDGRIEKDATRLATLGALSTTLDGLQATLKSLKTHGMQFSAAATGTAVGVTLTSASPALATHQVEVQQLAQAQQLVAPAVKDASAPLGTGAITVIRVSVGDATKTVRIDGASSSLAGIADKLRAAGVDAEVVPGEKGYQLRMTGQTGAANAMRIEVAGDATLEDMLTWQPPEPTGLKQTAGPRDAQLTVDGKAIRSASNTLAGAVAGVTLTLKAPGSSTVTLSGDAGAIGRNVQDFAAAVNGLGKGLAALKGEDAATNSVVGQVSAQVARTLQGSDTAALAAIGITVRGGTLAVDAERLDAAIAADPQAVMDLFAEPGNGLADRLAASLAQQLGHGGAVATTAAKTQDEIAALAEQRDALAALDTAAAGTAAGTPDYTGAGAGGYTLSGLLQQTSRLSLFDFIV